MEISFDTEDLRNLCIDGALADQSLGLAAAESLRKRLEDIRAADCVLDLLAGQPTAGTISGEACYCINLADGVRLTIVPSHNRPRLNGNGAADWPRVRRVRVVAVGV